METAEVKKSSIPWLKIIGIAVVVIGLLYTVYNFGKKSVQEEWDLANAETNQEIAELKMKSAKVTEKVVVEYVDRVVKVKTKGDTLVKYVTQYVTPEADANCIIPNNFIVLHNAAARNTLPKEKAK